MKTDTNLGREIRDKVFQGNPYSQLSQIRKSIWAISVLTDLIDGDKIKAKAILEEAQEYNLKVQNMVESQSEPISEDFLEVEGETSQETKLSED